MTNGIATPEQLANVAQILDAYCIAFGIVDTDERERVGSLLLRLVERGISTIDDLSHELEVHIAHGFLRRSN